MLRGLKDGLDGLVEGLDGGIRFAKQLGEMGATRSEPSGCPRA